MPVTPTYNWTAAFTAFCNNHPLSEIAEAFGIPLQALEKRVTAERWAALRENLPLSGNEKVATTAGVPIAGDILAPNDPFTQTDGAVQPSETAGAVVMTPKLPIALQAKLDALMANRKVNLADAVSLRTHAQKLLAQLNSPAGLMMEQLYHNKGTVVRTTRMISPADLVNIATYLRLIQEMTYRALGDVSAVEGKGKQDAPLGENRQAPQIIINLPSAIAAPRQQRELIKAAKQAGHKIIDITPIPVETIEPLPMHEVSDDEPEEPINQAGVYKHKDGRTQLEIPQPGAATDFADTTAEEPDPE